MQCSDSGGILSNMPKTSDRLWYMLQDFSESDRI